jgi:hypothetical protein
MPRHRYDDRIGRIIDGTAPSSDVELTGPVGSWATTRQRATSKLIDRLRLASFRTCLMTELRIDFRTVQTRCIVRADSTGMG